MLPHYWHFFKPQMHFCLLLSLLSSDHIPDSSGSHPFCVWLLLPKNFTPPPSGLALNRATTALVFRTGPPLCWKLFNPLLLYTHVYSFIKHDGYQTFSEEHCTADQIRDWDQHHWTLLCWLEFGFFLGFFWLTSNNGSIYQRTDLHTSVCTRNLLFVIKNLQIQ